MAARLAEMADWRVLLLEAGGEQTSKVKIPWFHLWLPGTPHDWKYVTQPQAEAMNAFEDNVSTIKPLSSSFQLQISASTCEQPLRTTRATSSAPKWSAAAVHITTLLV